MSDCDNHEVRYGWHELRVNAIETGDNIREVTEVDEGLMASIQTQGIIEPLIVRPNRATRRFELVAGFRRFEAAVAVGLETVPCRVMDLTDQQVDEIRLVENLQRQDLSHLEQAKAIRALIDKYGYTQEEVGRRIGMAQPTVANRLRLLDLPESVQESIRRGILSGSAAGELVKLRAAPEVLEAVMADLAKNGEDSPPTVAEVRGAVVRAVYTKGRHLSSSLADLAECRGCKAKIKVHGQDYCADPPCLLGKEAEFTAPQRGYEELRQQEEAARRAREEERQTYLRGVELYLAHRVASNQKGFSRPEMRLLSLVVLSDYEALDWAGNVLGLATDDDSELLAHLAGLSTRELTSLAVAYVLGHAHEHRAVVQDLGRAIVGMEEVPEPADIVDTAGEEDDPDEDCLTDSEARGDAPGEDGTYESYEAIQPAGTGEGERDTPEASEDAGGEPDFGPSEEALATPKCDRGGNCRACGVQNCNMRDEPPDDPDCSGVCEECSNTDCANHPSYPGEEPHEAAQAEEAAAEAEERVAEEAEPTYICPYTRHPVNAWSCQACNGRAVRSASVVRTSLLLYMIVLLVIGRPTMPAFGATALTGDLAPGRVGPSASEAAPEPALRVIEVVVQPGDTFWQLSRQWGVSLASLQSANPEVNPDRPWPGQVLRVPLWEVTTWWARGGETLNELADYYRVSLEDLARTNGLPRGTVLQAGQAVYVPVRGLPGNGVYHEEAVVTTRAGWQCIAKMPWPCRGGVSKVFGGPAVHKGLDIAAPLGTPVLCPRDGVVVDAGCATAWDPQGTYGLYVRVLHSNGVETFYAHLSREHVVIGQEVRVGDMLGEVGSTGRSAGPHLHFEVRVRGELVDPLTVLRGSGS